MKIIVTDGDAAALSRDSAHRGLAAAAAPALRARARMLWWKPFHAAGTATLKDFVAAGKIKPAIDRRYPLSGVREALRYVDEGHARGKVVITM